MWHFFLLLYLILLSSSRTLGCIYTINYFWTVVYLVPPTNIFYFFLRIKHLLEIAIWCGYLQESRSEWDKQVDFSFGHMIWQLHQSKYFRQDLLPKCVCVKTQECISLYHSDGKRKYSEQLFIVFTLFCLRV